jgi:hypothetical protein
MKLLSSLMPSWSCQLGFLFLLSALGAAPSRAEDVYLVSKLIWGTNDEKVSDPALRAMDEATARKFRNVFKWKHYYEVNRKEVMIPSRSTRQIEMSKQCTVEITELEGPKVRVKLIGEGKPLHRIDKQLSKGEYFTIAGGGKDETAWFVAIYQVDTKDFKGEVIPKSQHPVASTN